MNVKNRKCIRKLSLKSLYANRRRNLIAIFAIALTTLLFTSMFTIVLPESGKEVAMDTAALQLLGVTPELGAEVTVSYSITDKDQTAFTEIGRASCRERV